MLALSQRTLPFAGTIFATSSEWTLAIGFKLFFCHGSFNFLLSLSCLRDCQALILSSFLVSVQLSQQDLARIVLIYLKSCPQSLQVLS